VPKLKKPGKNPKKTKNGSKTDPLFFKKVQKSDKMKNQLCFWYVFKNVKNAKKVNHFLSITRPKSYRFFSKFPKKVENDDY